ncbi:MAG: VOC family protein [Candidatus Omnitrophica bacterium]|nr:VOC family protein [Candidatus Omnitrophota bacterium]
MKATKVLETCLYVDDLEKSKAFYTEVLGLSLHAEMKGRHVFFRCGEAMLLLFNPDATEQGNPDIDVPAHGARGVGHCCFSMSETEIQLWKEHLRGHGVEVEKELDWPQGGKSLYFRDPCGNSLELATPRVWGLP